MLLVEMSKSHLSQRRGLYLIAALLDGILTPLGSETERMLHQHVSSLMSIFPQGMWLFSQVPTTVLYQMAEMGWLCNVLHTGSKENPTK